MYFPVSYAAIFLGILPVNLLTYDHASVGWVEYGSAAAGEQKDCWWRKSTSSVCSALRRLL